jgi:hypothetical protein
MRRMLSFQSGIVSAKAYAKQERKGPLPRVQGGSVDIDGVLGLQVLITRGIDCAGVRVVRVR